MKPIFYRYTWISSLVAVFLFGGLMFAQELDASDYKMGFTFKTVKNFDNSRLLEVSFIGKNKKDRKDKLPVYDAEVQFFNILNEEEVLLGTSRTDQEGIASISLPEDQDYLKDESGFINLRASFEGNEGMDEQSEELLVKDLFLELDLEEVDSVKTAIVRAFALDSLGVNTPASEIDMYLAVGGMLSKMKLDEGTIDEGEIEFEFPTDLPGNINGEITVYAMIEDHEEYGNVIQQKTVNWGVYNKQSVEDENTLWSEAAPIWMYVVLTILLVGVWMNYAYSIFNLFKIRNEGRALKQDVLEE